MTVTARPRYAYQQSSESGRERHILIPQTRLKDTSPTEGDPACVTGVAPAPPPLPAILNSNICGTVITVNAINDTAIINFAEGAIYRHYVRNVLDYTDLEDDTELS